MVDEALHIRHQMRREIPPVCAVRNPVARPRLPTAILLAIGGWSARNACSRIEAYDFYTDIWINVDQNLEPRAYHGTAVINGCLYCLGGFDRVEYFNSVCKFDLSTRTWHNVAPMYFRRCYVSVALLDGYIYAMGGFNGHVRVNTAERYRPETNQWTLIAPMMEQRSDASSTAFDNKVISQQKRKKKLALHTPFHVFSQIFRYLASEMHLRICLHHTFPQRKVSKKICVLFSLFFFLHM